MEFDLMNSSVINLKEENFQYHLFNKIFAVGQRVEYYNQVFVTIGIY